MINKGVDGILRFIMAASAASLFVVTFMQVASRFIFKTPLAWSQDIVRLCFSYLVFFGAAYCVKEKAHLNIDVVISSLKPKVQKVLMIFINLVLLAFFVFLAYYGYRFAMTGTRQMAPYLPIPMSVYYMSIPLSAVLMFFYLAQQFVELIRNFNKTEVAGGEEA